MKFFIIGDTHHDIGKVLKVYKRLKGIDMILHTGDYEEDAKKLSSLVNVPVVSVPGNCDGNRSSSDYKVVKSERGNILLTHGHMQGVKRGPESLLYLAEENNCIAVIFGHTHVPFCEQIDGIYLINPGSLTRPRDGSKGSYAIATSTESTFAGSVIYYSEANDKSNAKGGFIKGLLNYSDRF